MADLNELATAIAEETNEQGEKLEKLDENVGKAAEDVEKGVDELKSAHKKQKKAGACGRCLIGVICCSVIIVALILYLNFK